MTAVDTSAEAIESAWEEFEISSKPTGEESGGIEMFNVEGMGEDAWNIMAITRALAAERDALSLQLSKARNAALQEAATVVDGWIENRTRANDGKGSWLTSRIFKDILSLKTPTTGEDT